MKFDMLNESFGIKENNSIFESDGVPTADASGGIKSGGLGFVSGPLSEDPHVGHYYKEEEQEVAVMQTKKIMIREGPLNVKV